MCVGEWVGKREASGLCVIEWVGSQPEFSSQTHPEDNKPQLPFDRVWTKKI